MPKISVPLPPSGAARGWSAQALPPGVRWPKNRVVGFLGEEPENFFERCPSDCLTSARLTLPATRWVASECLSTCGCRFSGDSPRAVAIAWKMRKDCVRSRARPSGMVVPEDSKPPGAMPVSRFPASCCLDVGILDATMLNLDLQDHPLKGPFLTFSPFGFCHVCHSVSSPEHNCSHVLSRPAHVFSSRLPQPSTA